MSARTFRMHSVWHLPFDHHIVLAALADADSYPTWWPQVREATRVDDTSGDAVLRSLLPISLRVHVREDIVDPAAGVLQARVDGDLTGWTRWTIYPGTPADGCRAEFRQVVDLTTPLPLPLIRVGRPILHANHRFMMWSGRRGLIRHLNCARIRGEFSY
ncbi:SRPBCC family protein [Gordonia sp. i37]|uniref:SRPBCC family protein n=1 Tax=Gordonia sp. i37 TaxID=1961707 RepID=UPI00209B663A|nr:SRPBCC family protein [Gordonia sp. i37]